MSKVNAPWNNYSIIHAFSIIRFQVSGTNCLPLGCHVQQLSMGVFELNKIERSYIDHCRKGTTGCTNMMSNKSHSINFSGKIYGNRPDSTYLKSRSKFILKSILLSLFFYSRKKCLRSFYIFSIFNRTRDSLATQKRKFEIRYPESLLEMEIQFQGKRALVTGAGKGIQYLCVLVYIIKLNYMLHNWHKYRSCSIYFSGYAEICHLL